MKCWKFRVSFKIALVTESVSTTFAANSSFESVSRIPDYKAGG